MTIEDNAALKRAFESHPQRPLFEAAWRLNRNVLLYDLLLDHTQPENGGRGGYQSAYTQSAWEAWLWARAVPPVESAITGFPRVYVTLGEPLRSTFVQQISSANLPEGKYRMTIEFTVQPDGMTLAPTKLEKL